MCIFFYIITRLKIAFLLFNKIIKINKTIRKNEKKILKKSITLAR